jgi:DNA-binding CsgD family transcriptional regulator
MSELEAWVQAVAQACYQLDRPLLPWLTQIAHALRPVLDPDRLGVAAGLYQCRDPRAFTPTLIIGHRLRPDLERLLLRGLSTLSPTYVATTFMSSGMGPGSHFGDWGSIEPVRDGSLHGLGLRDTCAIRVIDLDGSGIWFVSFRREQFSLHDREWSSFAQARRHIATAYDLRRKLGERLPSLAQSERELERGDRLIHAQLPLVGEPSAPELEGLTLRERDVLARALAGDSSKVIAYDLGLAHSTVRVLLARAAKKLGARSPGELLARADVAKRRSL